jgi:drug/metabolite transporter (DMT)-like permease
VITAIAAVFLLGEPLRTSVLIGGIAIVGGLALALTSAAAGRRP